MNLEQVVVFLVAVSAVYAATPYTDCGSGAAISGFQVDDCTSSPCTFVRGQNSVVSINMTVLTLSGNIAEPNIHAELFIDDPVTGEEIELLHDSACEDLLVGSCPIKAGMRIEMRKSVYVDPLWRPLTIDAKFDIHEIDDATGEEGSSLGCFVVPVIIT